MQRQGNLIAVKIVSVGEILDIKAQILISGMHGQGLIMHIAGHAQFCHLDDDAITLLNRNIRHTGNIQMPVESLF